MTQPGAEVLLVVVAEHRDEPENFHQDTYELVSYELCQRWAYYIRWDDGPRFPHLRILTSCWELK